MDAPPIQYCRTEDGVSIAYNTVGEGPPALLIHPLAVSHLGLRYDVPSFQETYALISQDLQLIQHDPRATGLSGPAKDLSADAFVADIETVLDTADTGAVAIVSVREPWLAVRLATAHPQRVSCLVLLAPVIDQERRRAVRSALQENLPTLSHDRMKHLLNPSVMPEDTRAIDLVNDENYRRWEQLGVRDRFQELEDQTVGDLLPKLTCPTLVVDYPSRAFSDGAKVANLVPHPRLVVRQGENGPLLNPDLPDLFTLVRGFIHEHSRPPSQTDPRRADSGRASDTAEDDQALPRSSSPSAAEELRRAGLTDREVEVLKLVATGMRNRPIAEQLSIVPSTVANHVRSILAKTGSANRTEAATWAVRLGLTED